MRRSILAALALVVVATLTVGWTSSRKLMGSSRTIQHLNSTGVKYFPNPGYEVATVSTSDSSSSRAFASFSRYSGSGYMTMVLYSRDFAAGSDTVRVGDCSYDFSGSGNGLDSCEVVSLGGSLFQVEAVN